MVFRGKFLDLLKQAGEQRRIETTSERVQALREKNWVVYAKRPFGSPQTVLDYLGHYTHRVALSNDRILSAQNGQISFTTGTEKMKTD